MNTITAATYLTILYAQHIGLFKAFSQWFFANITSNINSTALKLCDRTEDVMT